MTTKIKKSLLTLALFQATVFLLLFLSKATFASFQVAMMSGTLITMGSLYAYRNMIRTRVLDVDVDDSKDSIDRMDDPYDLYEEERESEVENLKAMIQEEKAKQKKNIVENTVKNGSAWVSVYRLLPYAFLVLGFLGLQNNHMLQLIPYMSGLTFGIFTGYLLSREWFIG